MERDAALGRRVADALKPPHKVKIPCLAAEFAVGEQLITRRLLLCDKVANGGVFGFLQCFVSGFAGFIIGANLLQIIRAQKAADIIVTIRKFDIFHVNHLLFEFVLTVYRQIFAL